MLVLFSLLAFCLRWHSASAAQVTVYNNNNCAGGVQVAGVYAVPNGICTQIPNSAPAVYALANCVDNTANSNWTYQDFTSADCSSGGFGADTGVGLQCADGGGNMRLDCSIQPSSCFSEHGLVFAQNTGAGTSAAAPALKPVSQVEVGDRLLSARPSGELFFDTVFRITHYAPQDRHQYVRVTTEDGKVLELSPTHELHANSCCSLDAALPASKVQPGDRLYTVDVAAVAAAATDADALEQTQMRATSVLVKRVERVVAEGAYNFHTLGGNVVVNGVVATHFTHETYQSLHVAKSHLPLWYKATQLWQWVRGSQPQDASVGQRRSL